MDTPLPRPAATIVIVDETARIYLVKRHGRSGFMAGAHVFPGGRVDDDDMKLARALTPQRRERGANLLSFGFADADTANAYLVAAVRETAEECGVLLARRGNAFVDEKTAARVFSALNEGGNFSAIVDDESLDLALDALSLFSWWVTPKEEPKRFDTRFFLAPCPPGQRATIDDKEVTEGAWMRADDALSRYRGGEIVLAPPTLCTLEDLAQATSLDDMRDLATSPHRAICPRIVTGDDGLILALPGDSLHDDSDAIFPLTRSRIVMNAAGRFESQQEERT